jgi:hypothetical protein
MIVEMLLNKNIQFFFIVLFYILKKNEVIMYIIEKTLRINFNYFI